jgi:hypothetical protein
MTINDKDRQLPTAIRHPLTETRRSLIHRSILYVGIIYLY